MLPLLLLFRVYLFSMFFHVHGFTCSILQFDTSFVLPVALICLINGVNSNHSLFCFNFIFTRFHQTYHDLNCRYYWKKNNILLYTNGSDGHITQHPTFGTVYIDNCRPEDEGAYQCFAENDYGISLSAMTILRQVYLMEFFPHADETHRPQLGSHLTLPCAPPRSYPDSEIIWVLEVNSVAVPIVYDNRVTMDHQGEDQW